MRSHICWFPPHGVKVPDTCNVDLHHRGQSRPEDVVEVVKILVEAADTPLMTEQLVPLDQVDTEEDGDAVVAVADAALHILQQQAHGLAEDVVEQVLGGGGV